MKIRVSVHLTFCLGSNVITVCLTSFLKNGKTFFIRRIHLTWKIDLWLTMSYQKSFLVSVPVLCFQIFTVKLILWPNMGLDLCNFYSNWILEFFFIKNYFLIFFFTDFKLLIFHKNIVKMTEILKTWNLLKTCIHNTSPVEFCIFCSHFLLWEKKEYIWFFCRNNDQNKTFCAQVLNDKWFCIKSCYVCKFTSFV